jgi:hypothetical protein
MRVRFDEEGATVDIENVEEVRAQIISTMERLRSTAPPGVPADVVATTAQIFAEMPRAALVEQLLSNMAFAFGNSGELPVETPLSAQTPLSVAMLGGAQIPIDLTITIRPYAPGVVRVTTEGAIDARRLAPELKAYASRLLESQADWARLPEAEQAKVRTQLLESFRRMEQAFERTVDVEVETGLPLAATQILRTSAPAEGGTGLDIHETRTTMRRLR